jgi:hypothetical protein
MKGSRKLIRQLIKVIIVTGMVVFIVAFYLYRYEQISPKWRCDDLYRSREKVFPKLTVSQNLMLGGGHCKNDHPINSYLEYSESKMPQTTRIGIFGCSFVAGSEVEKGHDFPSLVQDQFNKAGYKNVEVINFGLGGRGVHQMFMLCEFIGKRYSLDYVVFVLFPFHRERDCTFGGQHGGLYYSRYIINEKNELALLPVVGTTRSEVCETYYRMIPPWRYIRYDYSMPLFLKAALPSILQNRTNPFYYCLSKEREILKTYEMIFKKLSEQVDNLIIIANDNISYSLRDCIDSPNVYFMKSQAKRFLHSFLYFAPHGHNSYLGNQVRAKELFALLTGHDKPTIDVIKLLYNPAKSTINPLSSAIPLYEYSALSVNIGQQPVASFMIDISDNFTSYFRGENLSFQKHKIASLLMLKTGGVNFVKFIPLSFLLQDKEVVSLSFMKHGELIKFPIGTINAQAGVVGTLSLNSENHHSFFKSGIDWYFEINQGNISLKADNSVTDAHILVGEKKILKGMPSSKETSFQPVIGGFAYLRQLRGQKVDVDTLKKKVGKLDFVLHNKRGQTKRYPIISYKVSPPKITYSFNPNYSNPILQNN